MKYNKTAILSSLSLLLLLLALFAGCRAELPAPQPPPQEELPSAKVPVDGDFSKGILNRKSVIKSSLEVTKEKYPNSDDVLVDDYIFCTYKPDGTSITWDDTFIKILTEKGKRDHQTLSFYFSLPYSTVELKMLEIIKKDGKVVPVDIKSNSKIMINPSQMGQNIYNPNSKILTVNVPGLEIGDMVRSLTYRDEVKTRVPNTWSDYYLLEYTSPMKHHTIDILAPATLPLANIEIKDPVKGTVTSEIKKLQGAIRYK